MFTRCESNSIASESQLWKLTTTLRQQVQRSQNKNVFIDCRLPFSIFYDLTGCRSNTHFEYLVNIKVIKLKINLQILV